MAVKKRPVVLCVVSDTHAGGTTAMCPPRINLDDGGHYAASKLQGALWQAWLNYWSLASAKRDALDADLYVVFNGDLVEGDHHKSTQILTANPNAQAAVVNAAIAVVLDLKPDKIFVIRGTESHVGQSGSAEERIADGLRRDKRPVQKDPDSDTSSWWHLVMEIQGIKIDVTHHGRTGMREHTRGGAAVLYAHDIMASYVKRDEKIPQLCFRGHHHRWNDSGDACPVRVVTTGCWQMPTSFVHKVAADSLPDIGGAIVTIQNGAYTLDKVLFPPAPRTIWRV